MDFEHQRKRMVEEQLGARGVRDPRVLAAMSEVPRELFVPALERSASYQDSPLAIGEGQTISQPFVVAWMAAALELQPQDRVLEIGTGSGYAAAVLSRLAAEVYTVERFASLADSARERLARWGAANVQVVCADGSLGLPGHAPYNGIIVAAAAPSIPAPLLEQLASGGRLVIPIGEEPRRQSLIKVTRTSDGALETEDLGPVRFVPLIGAAGFPDGD